MTELRHASRQPGPARPQPLGPPASPPRATDRVVLAKVAAVSRFIGWWPGVAAVEDLALAQCGHGDLPSPVWLDQVELTATVAAIHQAAKAFDTMSTAPERETATITRAVTLESNPEWTVRRAATNCGSHDDGCRSWPAS